MNRQPRPSQDTVEILLYRIFPVLLILVHPLLSLFCHTAAVTPLIASSTGRKLKLSPLTEQRGRYTLVAKNRSGMTTTVAWIGDVHFTMEFCQMRTTEEAMECDCPTSSTHPQWSHLPEEIWLQVFTYLEPPDLAKAAQVCQHWSHMIGSSETLWKSKCLAVSDEDTKAQIIQDKAKASSPWKVAYQNNYGHKRIKRLWLEGKFSNVKHLSELPPKVHCPMDAFTWGEIFERELNR